MSENDKSHVRNESIMIPLTYIAAPLLSMVLLSVLSVTCGQLQYEILNGKFQK